MSWLDRIAARAGVERDWNTGVNTSAQTSAPADDSAWKYISAGDIKGLADYTNREYNYHSIPYLGQVIGHTANNATMGLANAAQFLGADSVSNYLYEKGKEGEAQLPEYREPELSLSYALDPNGLLSAGAMVAGSMLSMAPVAALAPVGGIAAGAARLAGNIPKVGGLLSNFAPGAVRWATTGPIEAMMEGGGTEREMLENGASREAANAAAWDVFKKNAALLTVTNALEGGLLSKLGVKTPTFKNPVANGISRAAAYAPQTAAEAVLQGYEEGAQEGIQAAAMGNGANMAAQILNPSNWTEGQWDAAKMGFAGGLPLVGGMAIARRLGNRMSRSSTDAPMKSSGDENVDALIAQAAEKYGVPVNLLHSIAQTESEYNQDARSEAGAIGMMQLMPDTAAGLGVDPNDLAGNIEGGAKYMRELLDTFDGDLEKAVAAYNAGPNAVKKHGGIPPYAQTQDYVRKVLGVLDGYDTSVPQRMRSLADDAAPYIGVTMDNGTQGCVEAVTKIGAKSCPFLAQELENGVVNVDRLVEHAGDRVIPFDSNQLEEGDVIVYGDASDPQRHVVLYDGKGGYIGNSTEQNKVVQGEDYNQMGDWTPTKIIKTGAQFGSRGMRSVVAPVIPDFTGLIADEKNIAVTQEAIQNLINTDRLTTAQHAAILQAAEMIRDMPVGDGTDAAADAEHVNEWQSLIDRKDIKGIFEKDPQKVVQTMTNLGKEQRAQKTRAAIENQQKIEETKQAIAAVQTQANTQPVQAAPMQGDQSVQQIVPDQVEQMGTPDQPENVMQMPQEAHPVSDAFAAGLQSGAADAVQTAQPEQPRTPVSQEELAGILSKVQQWEQPLLSVPEYVTARNRQDWAATAQIARAANVPGVAQFYDTLMEHGSRNATNITPYAPQQEAPHAPQQSAPPIAVPSAKAPVPAVGVRPNVPTRLPDNIEERRALGRSLGRFMTDNKINIPKQLGYDLAGGRGKAIQAANDKITAWEEKRAEQEADVNTSHAAQENAQGDQNTVDNRMLAQRGTEPKNGAHSVREKSAQNQADNADRHMDWIAAHPFKYDDSLSMEENIQRAEWLAREYHDRFGTTDQINSHERQELRKRLVAELYGNGAKRKESKVFLVVGLPASGKSSAVAEPLAQANGALVIDSDMAKEKLPEFNNGLLAGAVHGESSAIADLVRDYAVTQNDNIVLPLVGKTEEKLRDTIRMFRAKGYEVSLHYVGLPVEKSVERAKNRFRETGRLVAPEYVRSVGLQPKTNYDKIKVEKEVDSYGEWDNDVAQGENARLLETRPEGLHASDWLGGRGEPSLHIDGVSGEREAQKAETRDHPPRKINRSDNQGGFSMQNSDEEFEESPLTGDEREAVKGLSADAKSVYQIVRNKLSGMKNKKVARAASAGAVLLARHADIIARKVRATLGTPFTAMDYYRTWFDLRYGDAEKPYGGFTQKQVETQKDTVRKQYEGTAQWMKAPNGEDTNLTEDQWLAVRTPAFKAWFGDWETDSTASSKVLDDNGEPKIVYHGTKRKDRIGSVFRKERATSGPMAFFTDLYDIAENYSRNKQDTSIDNPPYEEQFRIKNLYGDMPLHVKWRALSPAKQQEITEKASHVTQDDDGNIVYDEDIDYGIGNFKHEIKEFRGNAIRALEEGWLNGGTLFGDEGRFLEVLKLAGVDGKEFEGVFFDDPNATDEGVFRVFMDMKKPFDTSKDITKSFMRSLRAAAKKAPKQEYEQGIDFWDKRAISPMEFVERVEHDLENGTTHAWTAIPDWVTMLLRKKGYNGIRDTGGKNGGAEHIVYIPFESNQIKSVDNNGAFSPDDVNIFHQSAWHGTPHDFDGFDIGAIGTGEGAQVHGWGLYFAQDRKVSEGYKEWLAGKHISYDGKPISAYTGDIHQALTALEKRIQPNFTEDIPTQIIAYRNELAQNVRRARVLLSAIDVELAKDEDSPPATLAALRKDASAWIREIIDSAPPLHNGGRRKVADVMQYLRNEQERQRRFIRNAEVLGQQLQHIDSSKVGAGKGKLFEVEIPDGDVLLDEQKPFDEQPKFVQEKLEELFEKNDAIDLLDNVLQLPVNPPELRQTLGFMRLARKNIRASKEAIDVLRDVLDKSASRSDRINAYRALMDEDIVDFDEMTDSYEDDIDNIEASKDYLEDVLSSYENGLKRQKGSYQKLLDSLPEDMNLARMVLSKMRSGREIYLMLSNHLGEDKEASLALNEVGIKGITYVGGRDGRCFVVFDDKAISIIEKFNQQMNEIVKGTTQDVRDGQRIVSLFEEADESTFLHEMGHLFLLDLERLADMSPTSAEELQTVRKWAAWSEGQAEEYKDTPFAAEFAYLDARIRAALKKGDEKKAEKLKRQWEHERFARGFEVYLKHGEAPTKGLRAVFAKFRAFLQRVYQAFTGTGGRATAEVEAVMARMIAMEDSSDLSAYPQGKKTNVYTDSGKKIPVQYRVVSADDLIASHDAGALEINPGYPAALQPRDRERVMMREQVTRMANTLRPEDLADGRNLNQGAPLIRNDGVVLNGNGRTIAIQRAQARNKERATAYRDYLVENAATFGFSKEEVESVKNPVLVREVQGDISDGLMQEIIGSTTGGARMGASEAAQQDAEKITYAMMDAYVPNDKGDLTTAANRSFVAGILHKLVGKDEMNAYLDKDGHVNADGIQRVKRALFALAYGDDELIAKMAESTDDDIRNVSNGLMSAAPMVARLSVKKGAPYVKELQDAIGASVKQLDTLRRSGESVKDYLGAQALFSEHEDSAEMRAILSFLDENKRSGKRIATYFSNVAKTLDEMETPSGNELFDAEMPSLMDVLEGAKNLVESGGQDSLFGEYIAKEADALYEKAARKFPGITDKEVADHVREAIQLTLDFGQGGGEIRGAAGSILSKTYGNTSTGLSRSDDYRSSRSVRQESAEKDLKRGKIYGLGITRKLVNDGAISLVGQKAETAADLAEIAQVLRHPGYEKFHYVYVDDSGNVKFHETVTSGLPGYTTIFMPDELKGHPTPKEVYDRAITRIRKNMKRSGATRFYIMHNHPSGDPHPSRQDFAITRNILNYNDMWRAYAGHVILDHNQYALIDNGLLASIHDMAHDYEATYDVAEQPHNALGVRLSDEDASASVANMYATEAETTAFFLGSDLKIRGVQKIHDNFKDATEETQTRYLRHCARVSTGRLVVLATSNEALYQKIKKRIEDGRDEGFVDVVLMKDGRAQHPEEKIRLNPSESWLGVDVSATKSYRVLENAKPYGEGKQEPTLAEILQLAPALKKAALEYGAKDERGKVTFADETRKQEFLKIAKALLGAGERKTSARRQESLEEMLDGITLIPPTRVSPRKRVLLDWGREMGVPVVFFKGDPSLHGFHQDGVTFLNVDSEITPQWTFWHEAMHWMKANNPDIYNDLAKTISGAEGFPKEQLDAYRKEIGAPDMSDADVIEEMIADALPDVKRRVPLLRNIGKRDTGLVQRVVAWIRDVMRRFHDHFHTPKGGLTSAQRIAMTRAFGNLVGSIRDAEGKAIFRIENEGARITLRDWKPLPAVKFSLDNTGKVGDNGDGRNLGEARKEAICSNVLARMKTRVHEMLKQGIPFVEIQKELEDDNSTSREEALRVFKTQWNIFNSSRVNKRNIVERITKREDFTDDEVNELFEQYKATMKEMLDYGGFIYKEAAFQQRGNREFLAGVHSWRDLERANARHGGSAHTGHKNSLNTKHLESQGAFSMPKFSARTKEESPKGNFGRLKEGIRSLVGVKAAENLELPGRVQRTVTLSPKDLEKRIRERWIQEKNIISKEKQKDGKIAVTYYPDTHDVGYADYVKSVRQVAKRNPFVKVLYDLAHKAMKKQEKLRNEFGKELKEFNELVKNKEDLKSITVILWQGDAEGKAFTDAELRGMGANERVIKAYKLVRRELEKAYKMLRDAQTQVKTRSQTLEPESVESFKKSHWIEDADVISAVPRADGMVLLTWRGGRTYDVKGKTMDAEALELMKKDENVNVTSVIPKGDGTFSVSYVERIKPVFRRTGYMPHFFHEWMIYEKYKDPKTGEERYTSVASGRTMNEAVKIGNEIAAKNKDKQYVLRPKGFDLGTENAVVIGDMDFAQMSRKLAESTEVSLADARSLLLEDAGMSLKSRHRFFGSLLERKDGKGFDQDVQWVLAHYLNGASRYIAMEEFKPAAISMYERFFGRFDDEPKNLTAQYCKNLINDVNGNPRGVEVWLNDLIKKTPIGKYVADSFGDRVALALNGELSTWNAITKLGLGNFASAAVNFSQFINVGAALNDYGYAMNGLKRALNPSALDEKIIEASGLLDDINMADDNGGYTQRRGGKVRGIYSALKKGGEWTLIPFQKADTLMRKAAVLGAYYQGIEQKGMKTAPGDELSAEALAYAQEINDDANFD